MDVPESHTRNGDLLSDTAHRPTLPRASSRGTTLTATASVSYREISDDNGRIYRVGESAEQIMGRSRTWMMWLPWLAMIGVSVFEYGFGAAEATLQKQHGWTLTETFWLLAIWNVFQSGIAFPAGRLREKGIVSAKSAM